MAPQAPVVEIIDDDDDDGVGVAASPPALLSGRRSRATPPPAAADDSPDFLGAFSPSPPAPKRRATPSTAAALDSPDWLGAFSPSPPAPKRRATPSPAAALDSLDFLDAFTRSPPVPKRRAPASATPIVLDDDTPPPPRRRPSPTPILLLDDTPPSPFAPEIPDIAVAATPPAYATPRSTGSSSVPGSSSTGRAHESSGASCPISLDSDDELDDFGSTTEPLVKLILPCGNSSPQEQDDDNMEENAPPIKERKGQKRLNKEEKDKMIEEKKRQREEKRLQKEANKIQQAEKKKSAKEKAEWASGKRALESIVAKIDSKVIETGSIGGALLTMFSEKKLSYQVERNPMRGSILWKMVSPNDQEPALEPYILFVLQAEEFCDLISSGKFLDHVLKARSLYPTFTICYVTHKLMKYIYDRKQLSWLSVQTNGVIVPNDFVNKDQLKKDTWFMSLLAIPKVKPRLALAIWKKYGTMRSLLNVYMDPNKSNREKELLLKDLKYEDSLGEESKKVGPVYSRRVYRMLMAENGAMEAEEAVKS
ncbi:hypothetical protein VPH35_024143 [Triticum aestivum]